MGQQGGMSKMLQFSSMQDPAVIPVMGPFLCMLMFTLAVAGCGAPLPLEPGTAAEVDTTNQALEPEPVQLDAGPPGVVNYTRIDATVACAGATPPEAMAELKRRGFVSVVNFRTAGEGGPTVEAGRAAAEKAGLKYFHMPFRTPTARLVEQFLDTVADPANQPIYIHCGSANRVGAMWLIKRIRQDGWEMDRAMAEAEAVGLRSASLKEFALEYVNAEGR